ncbi:MAG: hypothetical protein U0Q15_12945 [Kineosporiaceae bacterium]
MTLISRGRRFVVLLVRRVTSLPPAELSVLCGEQWWRFSVE